MPTCRWPRGHVGDSPEAQIQPRPRRASESSRSSGATCERAFAEDAALLSHAKASSRRRAVTRSESSSARRAWRECRHACKAAEPHAARNHVTRLIPENRIVVDEKDASSPVISHIASPEADAPCASRRSRSVISMVRQLVQRQSARSGESHITGKKKAADNESSIRARIPRRRPRRWRLRPVRERPGARTAGRPMRRRRRRAQAGERVVVMSILARARRKHRTRR